MLIQVLVIHDWFFVFQVFFDLMRLIREKKQVSTSGSGSKKNASAAPGGKKEKKKKKCTIL